MSLDPDEKWSRATFRVFSTTITPEEIEATLLLAATSVHRMGERISKRVPALRKEHAFFVESALATSEPLDHHIAGLCDLLDPVHDRLAMLRSTCRCDIFCGFSSGSGQGGFSLDASLLRRLAATELKLTLDLYPPSRIPPAE